MPQTAPAGQNEELGLPDSEETPSQTSTSGGAFASLRNPDYRILWWGGLFSFISVQMQFLLRGILAWELTEREGALGLTYLVFGLSMLVSTPLGGVATDRFSKRTIIVLAQGAIMVAAAGMGLAVLTGIVEFWMLLVAAVIQGTAFGFFGPARTAMSAELVGKENLGNAIALSLLSMNGTRIFAPSLAGVLAGVAFVGIGGAYVVAAVASLVSFVYLLRVPAGRKAEPSGRAPLAELVDGVRYVMQRPKLRRLMLSSFIIVMFGFNYVAFYAAMIEGVFGLGEEWVGFVSSASAIGAVIASIPLASRADSPKAKTAMSIGGLCFGLGVIAFGNAPTVIEAMFAIAFVGAATTTYQTLSNTIALAMAEDAFQGRIQSLMQLSFAGFGLAAAPLGLLAEQIGLRNVITIMGVITVAAAVAYVVAEGGFRSMNADLVQIDKV